MNGEGGGQNLDGVKRGYLIWRAICGKADSKAQSLAGWRRQGRKKRTFWQPRPFWGVEPKKKKNLQMR